MPKAGWCDVCEAWVWVAEDGSCQNGHDPEHVRDPYDAEPLIDDEPDGMPAAPDAKHAYWALDELRAHTPESGWFGLGERPAVIGRFNWGAFLLPELWPFFNGMPEIGLVYWSFAFGLAALTVSVPDKGGLQGLLLLVPQLLLIVVMVAFGAFANRLRWARQTRAFEIGQPRIVFTVADYETAQRRWMLGGWVAAGFTLALVAGPAIAGGLSREWSLSLGVFVIRLVAGAIVASRMSAADRPSA